MFLFLFSCGPSEVPVVSEPAVQVEEEVVAPKVKEASLNQQPQIVSLEFSESVYIQGASVSIDFETFDPDGDNLRDEIFWSVNGRELISQKGKILRVKDLKRGDKVVATLVVRDGDIEAQKKIETTVDNAPPQWESDPRIIREIDGYTVKAIDPDGDSITYRLVGQPEGMSISSGGRLSYKGSETEKGGAYTIRVIAEDPDKALVQWSFGIQLSPGSGAGQ
jgi:hypothetical protein